MRESSTNRLAQPIQVVVNTKLLVIGIGAPFRGDDELGLIAAEKLRSTLPAESVDFVSHSDDPARIIGDWAGREQVLVIDALRAGDAPGTLHRIDVVETGLTPQSRTSSHGNALADAIELSRALETLPKSLVVIGIEPETTELGAAMSEVCEAALVELVEMAKEEIACMSRQ